MTAGAPDMASMTRVPRKLGRCLQWGGGDGGMQTVDVQAVGKSRKVYLAVSDGGWNELRKIEIVGGLIAVRTP